MQPAPQARGRCGVGRVVGGWGRGGYMGSAGPDPARRGGTGPPSSFIHPGLNLGGYGGVLIRLAHPEAQDLALETGPTQLVHQSIRLLTRDSECAPLGARAATAAGGQAGPPAYPSHCE